MSLFATVENRVQQLENAATAHHIAPLLAALRDLDEGVRTRAAELLGDSQDERAVEPLIDALHDPSGQVWRQVIIALGKLGDERAITPLLEASKYTSRFMTTCCDYGNNDYQGWYAQMALEAIGRISVERLLGILQNGQLNDQIYAAQACGNLQNPAAVTPLLDALQHSANSVRAAAAEALGRFRGDDVVQSLIKALDNTDNDVRRHVILALGRTGDARATEALVVALSDENPFVRLAATQALGQIGDSRAIPALMGQLDSLETRRAAAEAIGRINDPVAVQPLLMRLGQSPDPEWAYASKALAAMGSTAIEEAFEALHSDDEDIRRGAVWFLGHSDDPRAVSPLIAALEDLATRHYAIVGLGVLRAEEAIKVLVPHLDGPHTEATIAALEQIGAHDIVKQWQKSKKPPLLRWLLRK